MQLVDILKSKYSETNFIILSRDLFKDIRPINSTIDIKSQYSQYIEDCKFIADFTDDEGKKIAILACRIHDNSKARTIQRNFIAHELTNGELFDYDAAFVAFFDNINSNWKLSLIFFDVEFEEKIVFNFKPAKRYSFLVGPTEPEKTYLSQLSIIYNNSAYKPKLIDLINAFSVNKITKDFYKDYFSKFKELYEYLISNEKFIYQAKYLGYSEDNKDKSISDFAITFAKKTLGQIVFLFFLQKKGWLGVPIGESWGNGDKKYIINQIIKCQGNYFDDFFEPLFYKALNVYRDNELFNNEKIPFLNGGLFNPILNYDWENTKFDIPNSYFHNKKETGLIDIFMQYNFTVNESDGRDEEVAVDPEMLGKIFESLLDTEEQQENGEFYTPRIIVRYMVQKTLANNIATNCGIDFEQIYNFILYSNEIIDEDISTFAYDIDEYLDNIKVLEPSVGSGAFLLSMLNEIVKVRKALDIYLKVDRSEYELKYHTIKNCLYGVDIESDAIEISKLRLWLSLIVDETIKFDEPPKPLPNLAFNLCVGDSLVDTIHGVTFDENFKVDKRYKRYNYFAILNEIIKKKNIYFDEHNRENKNKLYLRIKDLELQYIREYVIQHNVEKMTDVINDIIDIQNSTKGKYFFWQLQFYDVFYQKKGFDIVIGNPPYVGEKGRKDLFRRIAETKFGEKYYQGKMDLFYFFFHRGIELSNEKGEIAFITTNYYPTAFGGKKLRKAFKESVFVREFYNFNELKVFESARGQHNLITFLTKYKAEEVKSYNYINNLKGNANDLILTDSLYNKSNCIEVCVSQDDLYEGEEYYIRLIGTNNDLIENIILNKISDETKLNDIAYIKQGIVSGADKVTDAHIAKYGYPKHWKNNGIFIVENEELELLNLNDFEVKYIKRVYKNSEINKWLVNYANELNVIYLTKTNVNPNNIPNIIAHLSNYRQLLSAKRETQTGKLPWYCLHWSRDEELLSNNFKIVNSRRAKKNIFATSNGSYYEQSDLMFTVIKDEYLEEYDPKYILALLNSNIIYYWLVNKGKNKGDMLELYGKPLEEIPVKKIENKYMVQINELVDEIIKGHSIEENENQINHILYQAYNLSEEEIKTIEDII